MEKQPLLSSDRLSIDNGIVSDEKQPLTNEHENRGSWFGSVFTVMTCAVGSGVLSLRKLI